MAGLMLNHNAGAATYYVNAANPAPSAPYTSWLTAATNIQDAIAVTANGDKVLVTNGVYAYGGDANDRIAVTNAIRVESVNGPWQTAITGAGSSVRCAWLTNGVSLIGFTVTGGSAVNANLNGGGVWCASSNVDVEDCVIVSNTAELQGAGVYQGTLTSCLISRNGSSGQSAVYNAVLNQCTIVSNSMMGVVNPLAMTNCIIYFNNNGNYEVSGSAFSHCCTTPALAGTGNITNAPVLYTDGVHLAENSPCIGAGISIGGGTDIFGNAYSNPPSIGCAEFAGTPLVSAPQIKLTSSPVGFSIGNVAFTGAAPCTFSWRQNGVPLSDNGHFSGTQTTNLSAAGVSLADAGRYQVVVSNASGAVTSSIVMLVVHCVNNAAANPSAPYTSWSTAATNIQDAITASAAGDVVLVTNGFYHSGVETMDGVSTNRISINKAILVASVNGAAATVIQGAWDPTSTNGPGAVRCVWMTNNAILSGFKVCGGATSGNSSGVAADGGGVLGTSTNAFVCNCLLVTNCAAEAGGGAFSVTLIDCSLIGNQVVGPYTSYGGGAERCNLENCLLLNNTSRNGYGGGAYFSYLENCALVGNAAYYSGGGAYAGNLINCTVISNLSAAGNDSGGLYGAVCSAILTNCIVINNFSSTSSTTTNYVACTMAYCCADPLPSGPGNIDVNPQVLADGFHLAQTSPCIGAGTSIGVSGTDLDGQPWRNPPSIGCDEWYATPVMALQPSVAVDMPFHDLTINAAAAGQAPFTYYWTQNGALIQDNGHDSGSSTPNLVVNNFGPNDAGLYQVVVSNGSGAVTSAVAQVVIHAVNAAGTSPAAPYSSWATAATSIQDAINVAAEGDIVLVTNGTYATGGAAIDGGLTNRVALNLPITVTSVNGYQCTVIQGAWDATSTNGPNAVRCAWVADGAVLSGFTLENGATRAVGDITMGEPLESGGGVWCDSTNGLVSNCVLTNNSAVYGGGAANGTVDNSLIVGNQAKYGGGALYSSLNNCTVYNNNALASVSGGGGTYSAIVRNSIVIGNNESLSYNSVLPDNFYPTGNPQFADYAYSCTEPLLPETGNINADPLFTGLYHLSTLSPCYGTGSAADATGYDLDGQPWNNPPSMGCSEIIVSNLVGPLSVNGSALFTNVLAGHFDFFDGTIQGQAAYLTWSFGTGLVYSNLDADCIYEWTNTGDYTVTFTAYNTDHPAGVSTNFVVHVQSALPVQIQPSVSPTNGFGFQFMGQMSALYTIEYTTNLNPPITWQVIQEFEATNQGPIKISDPSGTNGARFYRVLTQ